MTEPAGHFLAPGEGELLMFNRLATRFRVLADWVGGAYCVVEQVIPARRLYRPHVHREQDQLAIVLSGTVGFRVGDVEFAGEAGAACVRPRGVPHANWNPTDEDATMLEITSPGSFEHYFRAIAAGERPVEEIAEEWGIAFVDEWVEELSARYGVRL